VNSLPLYLGHEHECAYLPGRSARMAMVPSDLVLNRELFSILVAHGFRRSGELVYRTYCEDCAACVPIRVPVERFRPNRSQRRVQRLNAGLQVVERPPEFHATHYALYRAYQQERHPGGDMSQATAEDYMDFLGNTRWEGTRFFEFREQDRVLAVAVADQLVDGFSAVYTFYDPAEVRRGLGTFAVLWEIEEALRRGMSHVYLGFWIQASRKMSYKSGFRPFQILTCSGWVDGPGP
jgi:arginyl-tRNA--protein-N-Asp/Glu arginylyltransferase